MNAILSRINCHLSVCEKLRLMTSDIGDRLARNEYSESCYEDAAFGDR